MIYSPKHPNANSMGYVYEYRIVAERKLGRLLTSEEIVHHIDGNPVNNAIDNLAVMSQAEHARLETQLRKTDINGFRTSGVRLDTQSGKWKARAFHNGKEVWLGSFDTEVGARQAVQEFWSTKGTCA